MDKSAIYNFIYYYVIFLSVCFSSSFIYTKALNYHCTKHNIIYLLTALPIGTAFVVYFKNYDNTLLRFIFILLICTVLVLMTKKMSYYITIPTSIISVGIAYCFQVASIFIIGAIRIFDIKKNLLTQILGALSILAVQILITIFFMRIKRFRNGFSFFKVKDNFGIGLIISGFVVAFVCTIGNRDLVSNTVLSVTSICSMILLFGIIMWIRSGISKQYREKLRVKEIEKYKSEIIEKDKKIEELINSNSYLAKVVHRDNHLIESLGYTIENSLKNDKSDTEIKEALADMKNMFAERSRLVAKEQIEHKILPSTGFSVIDGAMTNMLVKATAHNIDFDITISDNLHYVVNNFITQTQLETLLCDHIKDALISVETSKISGGRVLLSARKTNDIYEISVSDNGADFDIDVLSKIGIEKITTHKDNGGTGTGFVTTFETLREASASLIINEFADKVPFSKSVIFRFDKLGKFIINTYRSDLLNEAIDRTDIEINSI